MTASPTSRCSRRTSRSWTRRPSPSAWTTAFPSSSSISTSPATSKRSWQASRWGRWSPGGNTAMVNELIKKADDKMHKAHETLKREFAAIRTGRASLGILDGIMVDYYGTPTPLNQVANLSVPEPTLIFIQPWDSTLISAIEHAIQKANLGLNPMNDGKGIKLPVPSPTQER